MKALIAAALLAAPAGAAPPALSGRIIAVGIAHRVPKLFLRPRGTFRLIDQTTGEIKELDDGKEYAAEADAGGRVIIGPHFFFGTTRLLPGRPDEYIEIGKRKFRGNLVFQSNSDNSLTVIDEIGLEDYLAGVLPREMSPNWPLEALKAQAVVARTFALNNLGKYSESGYDLSDDARSQIYGGLGEESEKVRRAVRETEGEVLAWKGGLLRAFFHSTCGGRTADPALVWPGTNETPKPLRGVRDRYCKGTPHYKWEAYFAKSDLLRTLQKRGWDRATLTDVKLGPRGKSDDVKDIRLRMDGKWTRINSNEFRLWLGPRDLKSTKIDGVVRRKKGFEFYGRGYGHGVGLCQWGARVQAETGRGYKSILAYYFPGADIGWVKEPSP